MFTSECSESSTQPHVSDAANEIKPTHGSSTGDVGGGSVSFAGNDDMGSVVRVGGGKRGIDEAVVEKWVCGTASAVSMVVSHAVDKSRGSVPTNGGVSVW